MLSIYHPRLFLVFVTAMVSTSPIGRMRQKALSTLLEISPSCSRRMVCVCCDDGDGDIDHDGACGHELMVAYVVTYSHTC